MLEYGFAQLLVAVDIPLVQMLTKPGDRLILGPAECFIGLHVAGALAATIPANLSNRRSIFTSSLISGREHYHTAYKNSETGAVNSGPCRWGVNVAQ